MGFHLDVHARFGDVRSRPSTQSLDAYPNTRGLGRFKLTDFWERLHPIMSLDKFVQVYARVLERDIATHPSQYRFMRPDVHLIVTKVRADLERGSYNKDAHTIRATCRELKIACTYAAINAYFKR